MKSILTLEYGRPDRCRSVLKSIERCSYESMPFTVLAFTFLLGMDIDVECFDSPIVPAEGDRRLSEGRVDLGIIQ
jgi:hypothetical protein